MRGGDRFQVIGHHLGFSERGRTMEVIFKAPQKLGNRSYQSGKQIIPDNLAHNLSFKSLVKSGAVQVLPRDFKSQKIQMSHDAKATQKAKLARQARKAHQSAKAASSASSPQSNVAGPVSALPTPTKPISAGAVIIAAPATAQDEG